MSKLKTTLTILYLVASFVAWHRYDPLGADVVAIVSAIVLLGTALRIYFASIKSKHEAIARFKTRHGIPLDQPHKVDTMLRMGFFKEQ